MALRQIPGRKVWIFQTKINGRMWSRSTGTRNRAEALKVAVRLEAEAEFLRQRPETSHLLSKAILGEVERLNRETSSAAAERARYSLIGFARWLKRDVSVSSINMTTLADYQRFRLEKKASSTVVRDLSIIRAMLASNGLSVELPNRPKKVKRTRQRPFKRAELEAFFKECEPDQATAFLFLLASGARPAEAFPSTRSAHTAILKEEIDAEECTVRIRGAKLKPGQEETERTVALPPDIMARVVELAKRTEGNHLFPVNVSRGKLFDRILKRAGIDKEDVRGRKLTMHSFRHTYATMISPSISTFELQRALGHSQIATTSRYVEAASTAVVIDLGNIVEDVTSGCNKEKEPAATGS